MPYTLFSAYPNLNLKFIKNQDIANLNLQYPEIFNIFSSVNL